MNDDLIENDNLPKKERRGHQRKNSHIPVSFHYFSSQTNKKRVVNNTTINISKTGMFIISSEIIDNDTLLSLKINIIKKTIKCTGRVRWSKYDDQQKKWQIGIEFDQISETEKEDIFQFSLQIF